MGHSTDPGIFLPRRPSNASLSLALDRNKGLRKSNRDVGLCLETLQVDEGTLGPDFDVVERPTREPDLLTLNVLVRDRFVRLIERAKERRSYEMPWPIADYDTAESVRAGFCA